MVEITHDEMMEILEAHRGGRAIQCRSRRRFEAWSDYGPGGKPPQNWHDTQYRIKPEIVMVEIKVGLELDMTVAEACGLDAIVYYSRDLSRNVCLLLPSEKSFQPSTDLNDAFYAAGKVGCDHYGSVELPPCITLGNITGWKCTIEDSPEGRGSTPALAICAAILAVKG